MRSEKYGFTLTYRQKVAASTPVYHSSAYNSAIMRALTRFPEARQAVIAELDRIGQAAA
jgi:hypothetical protein